MTPSHFTHRSFPAHRRLPVVGALAFAFGTSVLLPAGGPAAAEAAVAVSPSSYICTGYAGCEAAGYSNFGYRERGNSQYWNMYSGYNCTNYVAYRMVQSGMPNVRPWSGSGNAAHWGTANASQTDRVPNVGAVAWWRANRPGVSGSAGHVAYVERVVSPTEIIVSENIWGGNFHWRSYSVAAGTWPDGFIHFNDADQTDSALTNKTLPSIGGTVEVGSTLTSKRGAWNTRVDGVTRQWLIEGKPVGGATGRQFVPRPRDFGKAITVQVTANKEGLESTTAVSAQTVAVKRGRFAVANPSVSGAPVVGEVLAVTAGLATPKPGRVEFSWFADGAPIAGATGPQLKLSSALSGKRVVARVVAFAKGYIPVRTRSEATAPIGATAGEVSRPARVDSTQRRGDKARSKRR